MTDSLQEQFVAAYDKTKANAGKVGWHCDPPTDRHKPETLQEKNRASSFLMTVILKNPQAIADQIKKDHQSLMEQRRPENGQPDALKQEERKHPDCKLCCRRRRQIYRDRRCIRQSL
jgi:hypothetical protein